MKFFDKLCLILFIFAAIWAIDASIFLLLTPVTIQEITAESTANGSQAVEETTRQTSWYEVQGVWGVAVLAIFALLFSSVAVFAFRRQYRALAVMSLLTIVITFLAGFSIGPIYLPAVFAIIAGWFVLGVIKILRKQQPSAE